LIYALFPAKLPLKLILITGILFLQVYAKALQPAELSALSIIPKPVSVVVSPGTFTLKMGRLSVHLYRQVPGRFLPV